MRRVKERQNIDIEKNRQNTQTHTKHKLTDKPLTKAKTLTLTDRQKDTDKNIDKTEKKKNTDSDTGLTSSWSLKGS